ncbi:MAG: MBL fold metallo-hydrolase [Bacteroidales bacterium]|nr:MBL fold metallo-hydrolase [Bacteroidales bacterium]
MTIKTFVFNDFQENTYVLSQNNECIIIDPGCINQSEQDKIDIYIKENNLKAIAVILTHGHIDHIVGTPYLREKYNIPVYLFHSEQVLVQNATNLASLFNFPFEQNVEVDSLLEREGELKIGSFEMEVLHVPGHSPGSVVLYFKDEGTLITGDVIFKNSIGRSDLPGGDYEQLIDGIQTKLLTLPDNIKVYPGHGEPTDIGYERAHNPFLK